MHVIFANATRGLKYTIQLNMTGNEDKFPGTFEIVETTRGFQTSFANLGQISAVDAVNEYNRRIMSTQNTTEFSSLRICGALKLQHTLGFGS